MNPRGEGYGDFFFHALSILRRSINTLPTLIKRLACYNTQKSVVIFLAVAGGCLFKSRFFTRSIEVLCHLDCVRRDPAVYDTISRVARNDRTQD